MKRLALRKKDRVPARVHWGVGHGRIWTQQPEIGEMATAEIQVAYAIGVPQSCAID